MSILILTSSFLLSADQVTGTLDFPSHYYLGGTQTIHYTEGVGDQAQDLVCYLPWWHEETYYKGGLYSQVVTTTKATVFGVYFDGSKSDGSLNQNYMHGESGAFDDVIAAAEEMRKKVKTTGKFFIVGHSSGATAAINFALAHPDLVDGVAALAPRPDIYPQETTTVPMMLAMNVRDWGIEKQIQTFTTTMKASQTSVSVITFPLEWGGRPTESDLFQHTNTARTQQLTGQWIAEIAALRRKFKGQLPPMTKWPYVGQADDPTRPLERAEAPAVYLPSTGYRDLFKANPRTVKLIDATGPTIYGGKPQVRLALPGDAVKPIGLALLLEDQSTLDEKEAIWDGLYLADNAITAVSADRAKLFEAITTLTATVSTYDKTGKTPLALVVVDPTAAEIAAIRKKARKGTSLVFEMDPTAFPSILPEVKKAIEAKFALTVLFRGEVPSGLPPEITSKKVELPPTTYSERKQHHLRLTTVVDELKKQPPALPTDKPKAK